MTLNRRHFLSIAGASLAAAPALAQEKSSVAPEHMPQMLRLRTPLPAGEIHVDPGAFALYWTLPDSMAIRYTVGIGRSNLYESGQFFVGAKKEWPSWTPTKDMIARDPEHYARYADGMPGGKNNPLGARALYLFTPEKGDTFLRIHGTNKPWTIASRVSNGCVRLVNSHIQHLYDQVPLQTKVVLH